jgi:acyl carrier protein phosphodiesterase
MNHLAHFHLAWPRGDLVVGGLEADFHRGQLPGTLAPEIVEGVALHRAVDSYTDSHPLLAEARALFPADVRRFAGIMLDLCFDHFLSLHWEQFSDIDRRSFTRSIYRMLSSGAEQLSEPARQRAQWMEQYDVLMRYEAWSAVPASASRVGQRFRRANPLQRTGEVLEPLVPELERIFLVFYPQLTRFCSRDAKLAAN